MKAAVAEVTALDRTAAPRYLSTRTHTRRKVLAKTAMAKAAGRQTATAQTHCRVHRGVIGRAQRGSAARVARI